MEGEQASMYKKGVSATTCKFTNIPLDFEYSSSVRKNAGS